MKTKKLTPRNAAPVKRENVATVSTDANAIAPTHWTEPINPFAGDDAE
ncbi:MAG: anacyclamide/piricyclamide family prenylated cyclic peptide [Waterburya sp.]